MYERTRWLAGAVVTTMLLLGGSAAWGQAIGVGPLQAGTQGNPLREVSCDIFVGGQSPESFSVAITASPPPLGGASMMIAFETFLDVPAGQTRTVFASAPKVPDSGPLFCLVQELDGDSKDLFATLSILKVFDDSIETVHGASGSTSIPPNPYE